MRDFSEYIDYFSIDWVDGVLSKNLDGTPDKPKPFIGSVWYPSSMFSQGASNRQLPRTFFLGHMDMILPNDISSLNVDGKPSFTKLSFVLDGVERTFLQIAGVGVLNGSGVSVKDYLYAIYPEANKAFSFNKSAVHLLSNVVVEGSTIETVADEFDYQLETGVFTLDFDFHISISGYSSLVQ